MILIPTILSNDPQEVKSLINTYEQLVDRVQIDIIDGKFADNKTIDPSVLNHIETNLMLDFHLMVDEPVNWIEKSFQAGADRIIGHLEKMSDQYEFVDKVQAIGAKVGLAVDLNTDISLIQDDLITDIDVILLLGVQAGFGGQKFNDSLYEKLEKLVKIKAEDQTPFNICVDGGITPEIAKKLNKLGADEVSVGRSLLKGNVQSNINAFTQI
jgi:ribulose-phosphate 3-epimerase